MSKKYIIPVTYSIWGTREVYASNIEDAVVIAEECLPDEIAIDGESYNIDFSGIEELNSLSDSDISDLYRIIDSELHRRGLK